MNRLTAIGLVSLVAYGVLLVAKWDGKLAGPEDRPALPAVAKSGSSFARSGTDGIVSTSLLRGVTALSASAPVVATSAPRTSGVATEFRTAKDLRAFADALLARRTQLTADERFHLAKALESCLFANSINEDLASYSAKQRRQFLATIPQGDPNFAQRVAAFDSVDDAARCVRFQGVKISQQEIDDLYRGAAQLGDARAQAKLLAAEIQRAIHLQPRDDGGGPPRITTDDVARIVRILETRDPEAILSVGGLLAQSPLKEQLRIGPNGEIPEPSALLGAFNLVACDLGLDCGAQHRDLAQACAFAAYCGAGHFEEHYQTFVASPFVYQQAQRYRSLILQAMQTSDWAQIGLGPKLTGAAR
jgi:hypothetical protein